MKAVGYIVIVIFISIYAVSLSSNITNKLALRKIKSQSILSSDKYKYGDLFDMSYLPQYQIPTHFDAAIPSVKCSPAGNFNLYVVCDSYLRNFLADKKYYCGVDSFFVAVTNNLEVFELNLNPSKRNVLLVEISERNLRGILNNASYVNNLVKLKAISPVKQVESKEQFVFLKKIFDFLFNKSINTNLELNVWDFAIFTPIKEFKADLNYRLFNMVDKNVAISPDRKCLLFNLTTDSSYINSSFQYVSNSEVTVLINNLNTIYSNSRKLGFQEVYLSIIPNPVSVLYPDYMGLKYNQLLSRVQYSAELKMPVIDIYPAFKKAKASVYCRSDSHWSNEGASLWLKQFNNVLIGSKHEPEPE